MLELLRSLFIPTTGDGTRYGILVRATGHILLGACVAPLVPLWGALTLGLAYWLIKELWWDWQHGGDLRDGVVDACAVTLGLLYPGALWWPLAAMGFAAGVAVLWRGRM